MKVRTLLLLTCCSLARVAQAEDDVDVTDIDQMPLEALLNTPTTVATTKATRLRESPGVLTVITQAELERMGARDLTDVLHLVPGFEMTTSVAGVVGIGFRGNWANEGKVLVLLDGFEMNELLYSAVVLGNHIPLESVDRIEIIRGPGSVVYGGVAELAVINIVTTSGATRQHLSTWGSVGRTTTTFSRTTGGLSYGQAFTDGVLDGLDLTADLYLGNSILSDELYTDVYGDSYDMTNASNMTPAWINVGAKYRGLSARVLVDLYRMTSQDGYDYILDRPYTVEFPAAFADLKYVWSPSEALTMTPYLTFKRQNSWRNLDSPDLVLNVVGTRLAGGLLTTWDPIPDLSFLAGVDGRLDHVQDGAQTVFETMTALGERGQAYDFKNGAAFGQFLLKTSQFNLTAGVRGELHSVYGGSFVPRVAITRVFDRLHVKVLASGSFKAPTVQTVVRSPDVVPEQARVLEVEGGIQLTDFLYLNANVFDITVNNPIVFIYDETIYDDTFKNYTRTGSRGAEFEAFLRLDDVQINGSYSFYSVEGKNEVDIYRVPGVPGASLGLPQHKIAGSVTYSPIEKLTLTTTCVLRSERTGQVSVTDDGAPVYEALAPTALVNVVAALRDIGVAGLDASLGVYNLLDDPFVLPQAYLNNHAPLPAEPFEVLLKARYRFAL